MSQLFTSGGYKHHLIGLTASRLKPSGWSPEWEKFMGSRPLHGCGLEIAFLEFPACNPRLYNQFASKLQLRFCWTFFTMLFVLPCVSWNVVKPWARPPLGAQQFQGPPTTLSIA